MTTKFGQTSAGKAPAFFIPASYKGHLMNTPIITPKSTSGPLPSNHVTSPSRSNELGRMTDSYGQMGSTNDGNQPSGHTLGGLGITGNSGNKDSIANNVARLGSKQEESQQSSYLLASPGGVLDLSMYNFVPAHTKSPTPKGAKGKSGNGTVAVTNTAIVGENPTETMNLVDSEVATVQKEKKRRRFRRPRRNSKLDKLIRLLEDKRVGDDDENAEELEDLQMPRLRKVLNIIFVTLGVCFLLAVIIVIMYTTIAT
ncbi:hypothetical protein D915_004731 [Fasciola hepatica]|uniref:Uncharacterized protein n=1 Tax=Fasciola hepatica TaxID=6192 RepID=A0A4E0RZB3_FASHE|nr:hypothetical protein D915_004731 [Fasciola hepatica]